MLRFRIAALITFGFIAALSLVVVPGTALASCISPQFQAFKDSPDTVVLTGSIVAVEPTRVIVDATQWWGAEPRQRLAIERPPADPTVITSIDWNPQAGEQWVIIARRDGGRFITGGCEQMALDQFAINEVISSLGEPVVPQPAAATTTSQPGPPIAAIAVVLIGIAAAGVVLMWRRSRESAE